LRRPFGVTGPTFVFDGGTSSRINLEAMDRAGLGQGTRLSAATLRQLKARQCFTGRVKADGQLHREPKTDLIE
jgi:hypothetical protein